MKRGEKALLTCKADYAYGETGSPPKIPAGATLRFEVELFDWSWPSITSDNCVTRKIIEEGQDWETPNDEAKCKSILYIKTLYSNIFINFLQVKYSAKVVGTDKIFSPEKEFDIVVGGLFRIFTFPCFYVVYI